MKAKKIKAIDTIIAGLEELKECLESEANKGGDSSGDEDSGAVSGRGKSAKAGRVPAAGKKSRVVPDDDDDVDGDADADGDDDDLPPAKGVAAKKAPAKKTPAKKAAAADDDDDDGDDDGDDDAPPAKKTAAKKTPAKKAAAADDEDDDGFEKVRAALTKVMNEESLGKARVLKILKKYGAERAADLESTDYAAVLKACKAALAEVETEDDDV